MSNINLCRVCLASNTKMHNIANTRYQEIFEKLATKLRTEDKRPETVCYICFSQLESCCKFMDMSRKAEEILTQFSLSGIELSEDTVSILDRKFFRKISWTPFQYLSINELNCSQVKLEIKAEPCENIVQLTMKEKNIAENEQTSEKVMEITENQKTITVKEEPFSENELISEKKQVTGGEKRLIVKEKPISQNEQFSENNKIVPGGEQPLTERQKTVPVKEEPLSDNEQVSENKRQVTGGEKQQTEIQKKRVKEELISENEQFVGEHKPTLKEERIKKELIEYEKDESSDFEEEGTSNENSYEEVSLTNPQQSLLERKKHSCNVCDKSYNQKGHLNRHLKIHSSSTAPNSKPSRDYTCEICGKAFIQKCTLKKHLVIHNKDKKYICDLCPTKCHQKIDIERHMRVHTGLKPFKCDICKMKFSRKSNLRLHILTHADIKNFVCLLCNHTFSRQYDLNRHNKRKHTGEKPYSCDICDFRSVNASYVKTHMENRHLKPEGVKPYTCNRCEFKCASASYLKLHMSKKHLSEKVKSKKAKIKKIF